MLNHPFPALQTALLAAGLARARAAALAAAVLAVLAMIAGCGGGGGGGAGAALTTSPPPIGPAELAVLIADGDADSEAIGRAYQQARGVPEANVIRVPLPATGDAISAAGFASVKAFVDGKLPAGVQATLITWRQPSRVSGPSGSCDMSITSAMAFGYDTRWCGQCAYTAANPYFDSASHRPWAELGVRPSMMLGAATVAEARALVARGVDADGSFAPGGAGGPATGTGWLVRTTDVARSLRYADFRSVGANPVPGLSINYVDNSAAARSDFISNQTGVMFYFTGLTRVDQIATNRYLPGAVADHLTSFGGRLPDGLGQMPATDWLRAGATGSFGTVEEPCAIVQKFPQASVLIRRYTAGDVLIEAYWKSVQMPGQGLFLGEPLARPWIR